MDHPDKMALELAWSQLEVDRVVAQAEFIL